MGQNLAAVLQVLVPNSWFGITKKVGAANADPNGSLVVSGLGGTASSLFITKPTIVKPTPGMICRLNVLAAGSGTGTVNDCTATAAAVTANEIAQIPQTVGPIALEFPCLSGIVVTPGTGQQLSVSYQ